MADDQDNLDTAPAAGEGETAGIASSSVDGASATAGAKDASEAELDSALQVRGGG